MTSEKIYFYPAWLRIWHGLNALGILILIVTGLSMNRGAAFPLIGFKPATLIHNIAGITVAVSYLLFLIGNMISSNGHHYRIKEKSAGKKLKKQARYYLTGMFRNEKPPFLISPNRKFNPLQKYSYILVMYLFLPLLILTGLALMFPEVIIEKVSGISGILLTAVFHSILGYLVSLFLVVHIYAATIGRNPFDNFKSILTGWQELNH